MPLLADEDTKLLEKLGIWQEKSMYGKKFMGIVRSTFLVDAAGKIVQQWDKVKVKGHADDVLAAAKELCKLCFIVNRFVFNCRGRS